MPRGRVCLSGRMCVWVLLAVLVVACALTISSCATPAAPRSPGRAAGVQAAVAVLTSLDVRQVVVLAPLLRPYRRPHHPHHLGSPRPPPTDADTEEDLVVASLCERGIQVSVSTLPTSVIAAAASPLYHRGGSGRPSPPPHASSLRAKQPHSAGGGREEGKREDTDTDKSLAEASLTTRGGGGGGGGGGAGGESSATAAAKDVGGETAGEDTKAASDEAARTLKGLLLHTGGGGSSVHGLLVVGDAAWVTEAAVWINQKTLLGPNGILILWATSGQVNKRHLVSHIRLAAKVVVIASNDHDTDYDNEHNKANISDSGGGGGPGNKSSLSSSPCSLYIQWAQLLHGGRYTLRTTGCWLRNQRLQLRQPLLPDVKGLRGAPVAVVIIKNFFEAIRVGPRRAYLVGYLGDMINALANALDFHYKILESTSFGIKSSNGSYDGVIGHIERREGELGLASLSIRHSRYQAIDFTAWLRFQPSLFVTRGPRFLKDHVAVFRPYSWQMWVLILFFMVFSTGWLWLLWRCGASWQEGETVATQEGDEGKKEAVVVVDPVRPTFLSVLLLVFKVFTYQGSSNLPRGSPGRVAHMSTWLVVVVLVAVFSGNLTAFLFRPILSRPPATIHELVTEDWTIRLDKAYGTYDIIKETKTEDYQTLYRRAARRGGIIENHGATTSTKTKTEDIVNMDIALVMGEPGAFHTLNENRNQDGECLLTYGRETIGLEYAAIAAPKNSLLKPLVDRKLRWMRQMGVVERLYQGSFGVTCYKGVTRSSKQSSLALIQLLWLFYVWGAGLTLAGLVFLGEVCSGRLC
ncbi:glutamate receptor 2-like [Eriocheir sinensis]|uniref:glutamate receptor 2-like n=1 Tax=Eriocheir sinensis TaxID=95602 RepID=UPI0021C7AE3B|nr:glutamate receptor 2-like [Eriocheir sinensis]